MKLHFLRHAESMGNATGNYSISTADSLSPQGAEQASRLATRLKSRHIDTVIASPLLRAMQTIAPYLEATQQRAEIWPEIAEACWHDEREEPAANWQSQPTSLPDSLHTFFFYRNQEAIRPAHPESFGEGLRRVYETMDRIQRLATRTDGEVLMVTHGHFIREILNHMLNTQSPHPFHHENCGMTLVSFNERWTVEFCNRPLLDEA